MRKALSQVSHSSCQIEGPQPLYFSTVYLLFYQNADFGAHVTYDEGQMLGIEKILHSELDEGSSTSGRQKLRYVDACKQDMNLADVSKFFSVLKILG
ncbi:hypothetical protein ElyMa_002638700 [Elysia marginata]|uniref:Uncharacterized protein n=1 Tax=Elysia marginata TaxID=1093978 RepID=A0AAV4H5V9_9GAST|nr:hypothetical protein ElyMa_002638700 [Elysia marginata]